MLGCGGRVGWCGLRYGGGAGGWGCAGDVCAVCSGDLFGGGDWGAGVS